MREKFFPEAIIYITVADLGQFFFTFVHSHAVWRKVIKVVYLNWHFALWDWRLSPQKSWVRALHIFSLFVEFFFGKICQTITAAVSRIRH